MIITRRQTNILGLPLTIPVLALERHSTTCSPLMHIMVVALVNRSLLWASFARRHAVLTVNSGQRIRRRDDNFNRGNLNRRTIFRMNSDIKCITYAH